MNNLQLVDKLTPAAQEALNELVEDYRNQVLLTAAETASRLTGEVREISVSDLLSAMPKKNTSQARRPSQFIDRVVNIYQTIGLLVALCGFGWFVGRDFLVGLDPQRQLPLLLGFSGLLISGFSYVFLRLRQGRALSPSRSESIAFDDTSSPAHMGLLIAQWQQIELFIRSIVGSTFGESAASAPFSTLLSRLKNEGTITEEDVVALRRLLEVRNNLVHAGRAVSDLEMRNALVDAQRLLDKLWRQQTSGRWAASDASFVSGSRK
jgi:hypothetical protein